MNKTALAMLAAALALFATFHTANAAELSITPPPIATPSYEEQATRVDFTYIGFDELDGDGYGISINHKNPLSDHSGLDIMFATYGFEFGDTAAVMMLGGVGYERLLLDNDTLSLIGFAGPMVGYLYFEVCAPFCFEDDTTVYGAQGGLQMNIDLAGFQVSPFVIFQSLSGSDVDTFTTTSFGLDMVFGDFSLSGALNQTEDDDVTVISLGMRF